MTDVRRWFTITASCNCRPLRSRNSRYGKYTVHKDVYTVHKDVYTAHKDAYTVHKDVYTVHKADAAGTHEYLPSPKHPLAVTTMPVSTQYTRMSTQCTRRTQKPAQLSRDTADGSATQWPARYTVQLSRDTADGSATHWPARRDHNARDGSTIGHRK
jgi:hypothetical protein